MNHVSAFPAIGDYAFLSDCEVCALVAPSGAVEWLCLPRPDSPSVFGALLDRSAGTFELGPASASVPSSRRYLPGSLVLETTWQTPTGWLLVHDCLVMRRWEAGKRPDRYRRAPADFAAEGVLLRIATCIDGDVEVVLNCLPQFDYGREPGAWSYSAEGYERTQVESDGTDLTIRLTSNVHLGLAGVRSYGHTKLSEGSSAFAALSWGDGDGPMTLEEAFERNWTTSSYWRDWLKSGSFPDHPWRSYLERSALTLKGLSYAPTGAILAAGTTSLPETPGGERNWDYRFTWVRDSAFMLRGLLALGFEWEAYEFFAFLLETVGAGALQIMYGIAGERELPERTLDHLSGYEGARPVRVGNGAWDQKQHDVWGMLLDSVLTHAHRLGQQMPNAGWERVSGLVEDAAAA